MGMTSLQNDPREIPLVAKPTKVLMLPLRPTTDTYITCVVCNQDHVEFEFSSRSPSARQFQGLHLKCAETIGIISSAT
jgi:hypothetical protein